MVFTLSLKQAGSTTMNTKYFTKDIMCFLLLLAKSQTPKPLGF